MSTTPTPIDAPQTLCYLCISDNTLPEKQGRRLHINCQKCERCYCENHASPYMPLYCEPCLADIQVSKQDFVNAGVAQTHVRDEQGNLVLGDDGKPKLERKYYSTRSKQIIMFGQDWLFSELRWSNLTETQCEQVLEYHRAAVTFLEQVITQHRIVSAHKKAAESVKYSGQLSEAVRIRKAKKREEVSLQALVDNMSTSLKPDDLQKLIAKLQASVKK